ncbi:MAG: replication-associated recombination protein A [Holosporales bacterium]|jgi:putative ATPase|nr:replication-associated recombination protein A [Holosporales bacterium]
MNSWSLKIRISILERKSLFQDTTINPENEDWATAAAPKASASANSPLAELLRPKSLDEIVGKLDFSESNLKKPQSMIFCGPPGSGKTTLARIISAKSNLKSASLSAVTSGTSDFRNVFDLADRGTKIVLVIDEIHHLNKSQQDIFLPHIENGNIVLIGTTTENPSFSLRPALLSRSKVVVFSRLSNDDLMCIIARAEARLGISFGITEEAKLMLCDIADGDARYLLNRLEEMLPFCAEHASTTSQNSAERSPDPAMSSPERSSDPSQNSAGKAPLSADELSAFMCRKPKAYGKNTDEHYNLISALHKSMRGSDVDAALYWLSRMLRAGEEPLYIARRVVRAAIEDVGTADPQALVVAMAAVEAYRFLGTPEGELAIAQAVAYVATAPKSNAVYKAYNEANDYVNKTGTLPPPMHAVNAPTKLMKEMGYGDGYVYDHDAPNSFSGQNYFPGARQKFYRPNDCGFEREIKRRVAWWEERRCNGEDKS